MKNGQDVRLLEIPADRGHGVGAFDNPKTKAEASAFANKVEAASKQAYGTAGPAFARCVIDAGVENIAARGQASVAAFIKKHIKEEANQQVQRAAPVFGLIELAGELLIEFGIAPWNKGAGAAVAKWGLNEWIAIRGGTGSSEAERQISQIRELIEKRRFDGFASPHTGGIPESMIANGYVPTTGDRQPIIHDCVGYSVGKGETEEWWFQAEQWKRASSGYEHNKVAETLAKAGPLRTDAEGSSPAPAVY